MSDEPYTNLDLDTAEELLVAAGKPELAQALRFQAQGVRNLVQGVWGTSFVNSLESLLILHIAPLVASQKETQDGIAALGGRFQVLTDAVAKIERDMRALDKRHGAQIKALAEDIAAIKEVIAARPAERAKDQKRLEARLAAMEQRLAALEAHNNAE